MANEIFFSARCSALESNLLTFDELSKLASANSVQDCIKLLNAHKIMQGERCQSYRDFLDVVDNDEKRFLEFLKRNNPKEELAKFFLLEYDYFNLECVFLHKRMGYEIPENLHEGTMTIDAIKRAVLNQKYEILSPRMQNCLQYLDGLFDRNEATGFLVDTAFKKSFYEEELVIAKASVHLQKILDFQIDSSNIELALRFRDVEVFDKIRLTGGTLEDEFLEKLCKDPFNKILVDTQFMTYSVAIKLIVQALLKNQTLYKFEYMQDCFPVTYLNKIRFQTDKDIPYIKYCFLKKCELTNLRIIFEGLIAGREAKVICDDIRRVYDK